MKFYKMFVDEPDNWHEISKDNFIMFLESDDYEGYYKDPAIVLHALHNGFPLQLPLAHYKVEPAYSDRWGK